MIRGDEGSPRLGLLEAPGIGTGELTEKGPVSACDVEGLSAAIGGSEVCR